MRQPFHKLSQNIKDLQWRYFRAISAFYIFDSLQKSKSITHAGKNKVKKNIQTWNDFSYFFQVIEQATNRYFFNELAKFFDTDKKQRTLTLKKVVADISSNHKSMTHSKFIKYRKSIGQPVLKEMEGDYEPITKRDIAGWKRTMKSLRPLVKKLVKFRNQVIAHDDTNKTFLPISREEVIKIFKKLDGLLNKLQSKVDWSQTSYMNAQEAQKHTKLVVDYLTDYKKVRLQRIEKKWKIKLKQQI